MVCRDSVRKDNPTVSVEKLMPLNLGRAWAYSRGCTVGHWRSVPLAAMVDASAIGQHESSGREHHEQSVLDDFGSILFLYAPRKNLHTVGDLQHCVNCEYVWLAGNKLNQLNRLQSLTFLRMLDVSSNLLSKVPDAAFFARLRFLQTLFLHDNNISKVC